MHRLIPGLVPLLLALATGCPTKTPTETGDSESGIDTSIPPMDEDNDGYDSEEDCDDANPAVNPGATETCNGADDDCDTEVDEDATGDTAWYADADADGFGDPATESWECTQPSGTVTDNTDCDDADPQVNPEAAEICDSEDTDEDCDGLADNQQEGSLLGEVKFFPDVDADGWGDTTNAGQFLCDREGDYTTTDHTDCNDGDPMVHPEATETCDDGEVDEDCDGGADDADPEGALGQSTGYTDADGDGWGDDATLQTTCDPVSGAVTEGGDCDDTDPGIYPWGVEMCDDWDADEDCDGLADDLDPEGASDRLNFFPDADADGWGDVSSEGSSQCDPSTAFPVRDHSDCDDTSAAVNPDNEEVCDGVDNDCDLLVDDDATDSPTWYVDEDRDGYGTAETLEACEAPEGYAASDGDCDDGDRDVHPGATEICDGQDDDCDGVADDDPTDAPTWYPDTDRDSFGDGASPTPACTQPSGYLPDASDCDDTDPDINPTGWEVCDALDQDEDCDGLADDLDPDGADGGAWWNRDGDGDGFGGNSDMVQACDGPDGYVDNGSDCDDSLATRNPGADETCNGMDDDCDDRVDDDAVDAQTWYRDADGDSWGDPLTATLACVAPDGFLSDGSDCGDASADTWPGAPELCDGVDNDCDGDTDEGAPRTTFYQDADGDGWGDTTTAVEACAAPTGYVDVPGDCDDTRDDVSPAATEICDDADVDEDCDGGGDDWDTGGAAGMARHYPDADMDGFGDATSAGMLRCDPGDGFVMREHSDCLDTHSGVNPDASEVCGDAVDEDCDTVASACEITWCNVQYPTSTSTDPGVATELLFGRVYAADSTPGEGMGPGILAQVGWGAVNTDPNLVEWTWSSATYNTDYGDDDEYMASLTLTEMGVFAWAFRFSGDGGATWVACDTGGSGPADPYSVPAQARLSVGSDADGDGYYDVADGGTDCDDSRADVNPGALEVCDDSDTDEDCDGSSDNDDSVVGSKLIWYPDADGDGYGDAASSGNVMCDPIPGWPLATHTDCDDTDATIHPGAEEVCDPLDADEDCDGLADNDDTAVGTTLYYPDVDRDSYGDASSVGAELCDATATWSTTDHTDCNDVVLDVNPGAPEVCDAFNVDQDCDGLVEDMDPDATGKVPFFPDADGDGFGDMAVPGQDRCDADATWSTEDHTDCDDTSASAWPGAPEIYDNGVDEDCDGADDASPAVALETCNVQWPTTTTANPGAFSERIYGRVYAPSRTPGAGAGEGILAQLGYGPLDSDPSSDVTGWTWFDAEYNTDYSNDDEYMAALTLAASDGGYYAYAYRFSGNEGASWLVCDTSWTRSDGTDPYNPAAQGVLGVRVDADTDGHYALTWGGDDCDDTRSDVYAGAEEVCDSLDTDEDCDGWADDRDPGGASGGTTLYRDGDGDGYGDGLASTAVLCDATEGWTTDGTDCDDLAADVNPGETEAADNLDNDCDDVVDDDVRPAGTLVITEIMYNSAASTEQAYEWFEVYNPGASDVAADGMYVYSSGSSGKAFYVGVDGLVVGAGDTAVFCCGDSILGSKCDYVYCTDVNGTSKAGATYNKDWGLTNGSSTTGYKITLKAGTSLVDEVTYYAGGTTGWPSSSNGKAIGLNWSAIDATANDTGTNWCLATSVYYTGTFTEYGTPNATNSCSAPM